MAHYKNPMGPNEKSLLIRFISHAAVPSGGGVEDALLFFADPERTRSVLATAETNMRAALNTIKATPDCPYRDDEDISGMILRVLELKENGGKR